MKRYNFDELTREESLDGDYHLADEVDVEIGKWKESLDYQGELLEARDREIARLREALEDIIDMHNRCDWYNAGDAANTARMALADGKKK